MIFGGSRKGFHIDKGDFGGFSKGFRIDKSAFKGSRRGSPIDKDVRGTPHSSVWGRPYADKYFTPNISRSSNADTSWPATSPNTENSDNKNEINPTREDAQLVQTILVPAHQISDRRFVTIESKRRKRKDNQTDCKAS